jgi:hypothetical protein
MKDLRHLNNFIVRSVATVRHFRHVPTHNFVLKIVLLMKNDKQRITYFNYFCFMFINACLSPISVRKESKVELVV